MTQQKSEDRVVPDAQGNLSETHGPRRVGGGKAVSVKEEERQLLLFSATADNSRSDREVRGRSDVDRSTPRQPRTPKAEPKRSTTVPVTMEEVVERLEVAFEKVAANRGAPGPDRQSIEQVREHLPVLLPELSSALLEGNYRPGDIRRVWIPKAGGGQRGLGIPNVVDRMVQEAVRSVFEPLYEPTFHPSSHGFRPGRSCQTAIAEARALTLLRLGGHLPDGQNGPQGDNRVQQSKTKVHSGAEGGGGPLGARNGEPQSGFS